MKKKSMRKRDFDPVFTSVPNQYSSEFHDLQNSIRAVKDPFYGPNPDGVNFDKAARVEAKRIMQRPDEIIDEANYL